MPRRVLVTGANGFVGKAVCARLHAEGWQIRGISRHGPSELPPLPSVEWATIDSIGSRTAWDRHLEGIDAVVHLAARVHVIKETATDPLAEFRETNTGGTRHLARCAAEKGIKTFVFMSTVGVHGNSSPLKPLTENDPPQPYDAYTLSKWEAEKELLQIASDKGLPSSVVRAPMVYGPDAPGRLPRLIRGIRRGIPLPLGSVENRRSLIFVENLADAIVACVTNPNAAGKTFMVSDQESISTPDLIRKLAEAMGRPARLMPFPPGLLRTLSRMAGKRTEVDRLLGSMVVDSSKIQKELGWKPKYSQSQGLEITGSWYRLQEESLR